MRITDQIIENHGLKSQEFNDIKKLFYKLDGKAHERVVEEIYKL